MIYELVNPSDHITLETDCFEAAACATLLVGNGQYAAEPAGEGERVPIFLLGGFDEWFAKRFPGVADLDALLAAHRPATIDCLLTFVVGNRDDFEAGSKHAPDRDAFRREWNERKHTSMNDITGRAQRIAEILAEKEAA